VSVVAAILWTDRWLILLNNADARTPANGILNIRNSREPECRLHLSTTTAFDGFEGVFSLNRLRFTYSDAGISTWYQTQTVIQTMRRRRMDFTEHCCMIVTEIDRGGKGGRKGRS
jgi:hypothetical protein